MRNYGRVGVTVLLLALSVATVIAMSPAHTFDSAVQSTFASNPNADGMKMYLDDEGNITSTPTDEAIQQLDPDMTNLLRHDSEGLAQVALPNGGVFLDTAGRYGDVVVLRVDANGRKVICQNDEAQVIKGLNDKSPTGPEVK
jgi:hypothetical protein